MSDHVPFEEFVRLMEAEKERVQQVTMRGDLYANSPTSPTVQRNVDVLLMFGPLHGKTFCLPPSCLTNGVLVAMEEIDDNHRATERRLMQMNPGYDVYRPMGLEMQPSHFYKKMEEYSNSNMEEVVLYAHDDSCCEKTMEDTNDKPTKPRATRPRNEVRPIW
jgi:hypothetical protein